MSEPNRLDACVLLTVGQVAKLLQVSPRSVWRLRSAREIPEPVKIGGTVRWIAEELESWVASGCPRIEKRHSAINTR